ncbi:MAG: phosphoribosylformylglycinamidine synthase subunit PurL [Methyloligellaceae bacterium]
MTLASNPLSDQRLSDETITEHGLTTEEYQKIVDILDRHPSLTELGIFSVMWSEHCSYKSSKFWLKTLPVDAPHVIQGPGENAGVIDVGDGDAVIFKMESHNHPSYIEPYQGAATGVGGIMRDVFTMGARPVANMNALRFGAPEHPKTRHLVDGVVAGIGGYGNCMGIPTVGGETNFDADYNENILVNAMCVGLARTDKIFYSAATGVGNPVVYVGSKTGRDGIHGATMASAEFDENSDEKRPTVQVGDPFTEKLLLEACLELMQQDVIIAIQDMGAAGLTSSSVEMADKGSVGIDLDLDTVPQRELDMTAYEMMLSESQERMLMILRPGSAAEGKRIFDKWGLNFAIVGTTTETGRLIATHNNLVEADLPVSMLANSAPEYQRPFEETEKKPVLSVSRFEPPSRLSEALLSLMNSPHLCSRFWIWDQYDHTVMGDTIIPPGGDAALVRIHGSQKAIAISTDVTPRYCLADAFEGAKQAVAETWRNITCTGANPLAITNCLNFGNPERPEIMGQFVAAIKGMRQACLALDFPVISGNVSLYNETMGRAIPPTPAIGGVGLLEDINQRCSIGFKNIGENIIVLGEENNHLGQSIYASYLLGLKEGAPPPVDLEAERRTGDFVRNLISTGEVSAVHDCSDGGLLIALAEMALSGNIGADILIPDEDTAHGLLFGEDQGRYVVTVPASATQSLMARAKKANISARLAGITVPEQLTLGENDTISLKALKKAHEEWLPNYMSS